MSFLRFVWAHRVYLGFGLLLTYFSSFGQTFFVSLLVPSICQQFGLAETTFGTMYSVATLASAGLLAIAGPKIDSYPLRQYSVLVIVFLACSLVLVAYSPHWVWLFIGLVGLRFGGQGLLAHIAMTAMSRYFTDTRGKAISVASLGVSIGEALIPVMLAGLIYSQHWGQALLLCAAGLLLVAVPYTLYTTSRPSPQPASMGPSLPSISQREVLRSKYFWQLAPNVFALTVIATALFFYQVGWSIEKGWGPQWIAYCFSGYAVARLLASLYSGVVVDKLSAQYLFPIYLLPYVLALLIAWYFGQAWAAMVYMLITGFSLGFGATIRNAILVELFGTQSIGTVRSLFTTMMVLGTAVGPVAYAQLLRLGFSYNALFLVSAIAVAVINLQSFQVYRTVAYRRWKVRYRQAL